MISFSSIQKFTILLFLCLATGQLTFAQYKKVNIFTKSGRIYEMGINYRIQGGERSGSPGFYISVGRSRDDRRIHHWFDMGLNAGTKFNYMTVSNDFNNIAVPTNVTGKTGMDYTISYTLGYFLADNSDPENLVLPFISGTIGYASRLNLNDYTYTPTNVSLNVYPSEERTFLNAAIGAGILYRMNEKIGIRVSGSYVSVTTPSSGGYAGIFQELKNHPAVQLALRFNIGSED